MSVISKMMTLFFLEIFVLFEGLSPTYVITPTLSTLNSKLQQTVFGEISEFLLIATSSRGGVINMIGLAAKDL